ncbi:MAG: DUF1761 domain-containing protein [Patescibacteria group bacterium]
MSTATWLPLLAAGVANVIVGFIWYHPNVFGGTWIRFLNLTPEMTERGKKSMLVRVLVAFLASMVAAYVMRFIGVALGVYDWVGAVTLGFSCWIGFVAPAMLGTVLWEQKPIRYYAIVSGYWLVAFIVMALVLLY